MKKLLLLSILLIFGLGTISWAQPIVNFRVTSPRVIRAYNDTYGGDCDNLAFKIEVSTSSSSYYWGIEIHMTNNNAALTDLDWIKGPLCSSPDLTPYTQTFNLANGNINISSSNIAYPPSNNNPAHWVQLTTSYQLLGTVHLRITDITAVENCAWLPALMAVSLHVQIEKTFGPGSTRDYSGITTVGTPITDLYTGRIYCNAWGWSQVGGPTDDVQYIDWTTARNTSVWDTTGGTAGLITDFNSLAGGLRVHPGARVKIAAGGSLTCSGNTEVQEPLGLIIGANATGNGQFIDNGTITYSNGGYARAELYLAQDKWHYYVIPLTQTITGKYEDVYMKYYKETKTITTSLNQKWTYVIDLPLDSVLNSTMLGYAMWSSSTQPPLGNHTCIPGGTLNTGNKSITLTRSATPLAPPNNVDGWNLTGNPYVSGVDWDHVGWTLTTVDPTMYVWTGSAYVNWNRNTHSGTKTNSGDLASQEGFFVHVTSGASGTLDITNAAREITGYLFPKSGTYYPDKLILTAAANGYEDVDHVVFYTEATPSFDSEYDAYKLWGIDGTPNLFSYLPQDVLASCNWLPWESKNQVVPMGFWCSASGTYSITASNLESFKSGTQIFIEDKITNPSTWQELTVQPEYNFSYTAGEDMNRFVLHFTNPFFGIDNQTLAGMQIYSFEDHVYIKNLVKGDTKGDVLIYDMLGRKVFQDKLQNTAINKYRPGVNEGYYAVRVVTPDNIYLQKVYLH